MYITRRATFEAAKRIIEIMQAEAPEMFELFKSYDASKASERPYSQGRKPVWTPFTSVFGVNAQLYRNIIDRAATEYNLSDADKGWIAGIAASIVKGESVEVRD